MRVKVDGDKTRRIEVTRWKVEDAADFQNLDQTEDVDIESITSENNESDMVCELNKSIVKRPQTANLLRSKMKRGKINGATTNAVTPY